MGSGPGAASTFSTGSANLGGGLGGAGSIDSSSSINTPLPGGIGPAPGAPDATAGDTTLPDTNNADLSMPTSPFAKPPASADDMAPSATPSPAIADTPIRRALSALRLAKYDQALTMLSQILQSDPGNSQAHYLKAVAFVMTRHYSQAADEYRQCLKLNPATDIANRARAGLAKLSH
jgi:TolA-binding protein